MQTFGLICAIVIFVVFLVAVKYNIKEHKQQREIKTERKNAQKQMWNEITKK